MVALATISVLSRRWRPPTLGSVNIEQHPNIFQIVPRDLLDARIDTLDLFVQTSCPSIHLEYYVYVFTVACVVCSAAFSLAARSAGISMWYPLLLLLIPAGLNIWTNQRRSGLIDRIRSVCSLNQFDRTTSFSHILKPIWIV
ncbi:hypothetical protein CLU79DRAFT_150446 [Phycomyces nitens]|nr:hypothetical protein CLU79DRAFT_150446 [Phycomyces nitens]